LVSVPLHHGQPDPPGSDEGLHLKRCLVCGYTTPFKQRMQCHQRIHTELQVYPAKPTPTRPTPASGRVINGAELETRENSSRKPTHQTKTPGEAATHNQPVNPHQGPDPRPGWEPGDYVAWGPGQVPSLGPRTRSGPRSTSRGRTPEATMKQQGKQKTPDKSWLLCIAVLTNRMMGTLTRGRM
ncbi:hypothetical protein MRX96_045302, partial [Rhipicephalus microplus]